MKALHLRIHDWNKFFSAQVDATNGFVCAVLDRSEEGNIDIHIVMSIKK